MEKRYLTMTMGILMSVTMVMAGCSGNGTSAASGTTSEVTSADSTKETAEMEEVSASDYAGQTVYGEITAVEDSSVTVALGELDDESENADDADSSEKSGRRGPGSSASITPSGEQMTVDVTEETEITGQGGRGGMHGGEARDGKPGDGEEAPDGKPGDKKGKTEQNGSSDTEANDSGNSSEEEAEGSSEEKEKADIPEKPEGEQSGSDATGGSAPDGEIPDGKPGGSSENLTVSDLEEGDIVSLTIDEDGNVTEITVISSAGVSGEPKSSGEGGQPGGQSTGVESYDAATEYTSDTTDSGQTIESTGTDENAVHAYEGASVTLSDMTITRDSDSSTGGDNSSFYGVGAAVLETEGTLYLSDSEITTDAKGGAGVFAYGDGTVYLANTLINTSQDTSGGIHVAGGGTMYAWDVTATTQGESSAAIRSDRGGGTMVVDGGTYTSNGTGSPAIYSTADITVNDATLVSNNSEAICIEGLNTIRLFDCDLSGNMQESDQNDCTWNVILYQSMSGDSEVGNSTFEMSGGSLTANNGGMFYTTNTESTFVLEDVDITYAAANDFFLKCTGNSNQRGWGTTGENGADCLFTAIDQDMEGDVIWDSISQLDFYMTGGSTLTGAVVDDESNAGDGGDGYCSLYISEDSTWTVTGDSTLTNLYSAGTIEDENGNTVTIQGTDGTTYVNGNSEYTITVSSYSTEVDLSGASSMESWSEYEVEKPSELG